MFRLDREKLTTPCDLCKHNHSRRVYGAILSDHLIRCAQAEQINAFTATGEDNSFGHKPQEIHAHKDDDGQMSAYVICPKFELDIDRLEDVVYNKKSFMWQICYVGLIDMEGNVKTAFDPFQIAINTAKAWMNLVDDSRRNNKALRKLYNELQVKYPRIRAEEHPVQLEEAFAALACIDAIVYKVLEQPLVFKTTGMRINSQYAVNSAKDWVYLTTSVRLDSAPILHTEKDTKEIVEKTIECIKHYNVDFYNLIKQ